MNSCRGNSFLWYHTDYFIRNLNSKERLSGCAYRLKSEKRQIVICGDAQSLPCVRGGGKNLLIFAGGVVNPPVSFADSPLYTRGPLGAPNSNLSSG